MTQKEHIRKATEKDFPVVYEFVKALWTYNTYEEATVRQVYQKVLDDENSFAWLYEENGVCRGFCHGDYFQTFWMSGLTCYVSSLITREEDRGKGYGKKHDNRQSREEYFIFCFACICWKFVSADL